MPSKTNRGIAIDTGDNAAEKEDAESKSRSSQSRLDLPIPSNPQREHVMAQKVGGLCEPHCESGMITLL
jgi:hypothetical protein